MGKKPSEERKKLTIYTADRIVELLITNRVVVDAKSLICKLPENFVYNDKSTLFITTNWMVSGRKVKKLMPRGSRSVKAPREVPSTRFTFSKKKLAYLK